MLSDWKGKTNSISFCVCSKTKKIHNIIIIITALQMNIAIKSAGASNLFCRHAIAKGMEQMNE